VEEEGEEGEGGSSSASLKALLAPHALSLRINFGPAIQDDDAVTLKDSGVSRREKVIVRHETAG